MKEKKRVLENLEPSDVLFFFEEICKYPHGSGNEKALSDYLVSFAVERKLKYIQDDINNVIIFKSGSDGKENNLPIIIQSHIDMVCEKNKATAHNFATDGINLVVDENKDFIYADGTTLGADNGIAVAMTLALLDSDTIVHPPIEAVFTTFEEVGMNGAEALDTSVLSSKKLINIDSEEEGVFMSSCAGGLKTALAFPVNYMDTADKTAILVTVEGLKGGHSGMDIHKERGNSIVLLARTLYEVFHKLDRFMSIETIIGGSKDNAIPREAEAVILVKKENVDVAIEIVNKMNRVFMNEYRVSDANVNVHCDVLENKINKAFTYDSTHNLLTTLLSLPNGVLGMSLDIPGLVETSNNIGVVKTITDAVEIVCAVRSSIASKKEFVLAKIRALTEEMGGVLITRGDYPAWQYNPDSNLRKLFCDVYEKNYGKVPKIDAIHAGLECGLFAEKIKGLDMISFGPDLFDVHTPNEHISIASISRSWDFIKLVLKEL